ncbi:MAG TPA: maleylpyruvate isomerase N-terminal domain-containing protein [Chloroflexia bacterium]|nr:maleylpyruvate isomerase N-terminal domain-containing protein [Chloroflexia bacterium]
MDTQVTLRNLIRSELEETQRAYHGLLGTLTEADWNQPSGNPSLTVGDLMSHLADDVGVMVMLARGAQKGRGCNPPEWLFYLLNPLRVRWGARNATRHTVGTKYDRGHAALCALLETIPDGDWEKGASFLGRYTTVAGVFRLPVKHFAQHATDIDKVLRHDQS